MAKKTEDQGLKTLKEDLRDHALRPLYFFHGEETYLRDYYLGRVKEQLLPPGAEDFNYKQLEGKSCTALDILKAADCLPMMNDRTLVLVSDYDLSRTSAEEKRDLAGLFSDLPDYLCLVFFFDTVPFKRSPKEEKGERDKDRGDAEGKALSAAIKKYGVAVDFARQSQGDLNDWISRHFKAAGHDIDTRTAEYLTFYTGDLMTNLSQEIAKIAAYAKGRRITREDIEAVAIPQPDAKTYELTDAIAARNPDKALSVLGDLYRMQLPHLIIVASLSKYFRQLYAARVALETRRDADALVALGWAPALHPYAAARLMAAARRVDMDWIRASLEKIARTDLAAKSGGEDPAALLTQLVLELVHG